GRGESVIAEYRIYRIDKQNRVVGPATEIVIADDQQAIEQAKQFVDGCDVELWEGARLVRALTNSDVKRWIDERALILSLALRRVDRDRGGDVGRARDHRVWG